MSTPPPSLPQSFWWKRLAIQAFSFGFGFVTACALAVAGYFVYQHHEGSKPWTSPMKAAFTGLSFRHASDDEVIVEFQYAVENTTTKDYQIPIGSTLMMVLPDGRGFQSAEQSHITWRDDAFIPAGQKVNITVTWSITRPDYTMPPNGDTKVAQFVNRRLSETDGFAIFDQQNRYRLDLPEVWRKWSDVKKIIDERLK